MESDDLFASRKTSVHKEILKIMYSICSYVDIAANVSHLSIQYL